jgi:hypothetical protein
MYNDNRVLFIQSYLERIVKQLDLVELLKKKQTLSQDKAEEKALNTAFEIFAMSVILDKSIDEIYITAAIIDDSDGGLDGIYFSEDNGKPKMQVFQCKNSKKFGQANLSQNALEKFKNDFDSIFVKGTKKNAIGLKHKIKEYDSITATKIIPPCLYFVFNGDKSSPENSRLFQEFHKPNEFEIWDIHDLFNRIYDFIKLEYKRKKIEFAFKPEPSNITAKSDTQAIISFAVLNVKALLFRLKALELCELFELEKATNGTIEKIFAENIRGFLGKENSTNEKIAQTLASETQSVYFPFLNNGLTIVCQRFTVPQATQLGKYVIPCENPVIVNGLQTSYLVYQQYLKDKESLEDVYLTVKLYETQDQELIDLITDATNTQSAIWFKDKLSNKKFNVYTKEFFANKGIGYLTKQGETFTNTDFKHQISSEYLLILWYKIFFGVSMLDSKEEILKYIFAATNNNNHLLHKLFNGDINSPIYSQLYFTYFVSIVETDFFIPTFTRKDNFDILVANSLFNQKAITLQDIKKRQQEIAEIADTIYKSKWKKGFLNALFNKISTEFSVSLDENIFEYGFETYQEQEIIDKISKLYIDVSLLKIE